MTANGGFFLTNLLSFFQPYPLTLTTPTELLPGGWTTTDLWCAPLVTGLYAFLTHAQPFWADAHGVALGLLGLGVGAGAGEGEGGAVTNGGRPGSTTNRMPAARPPPAPGTNPPPSSRAAGKKPMAYTPAPAQDPPPPSRRAAAKAPISSHAYGHNHSHHHPSPPSSNASAPHKPRPPAAGQQQPKNNKIWSTSTTEERERIKEFWLGLGEDERRNLVKIEKEAVLKKMKEQQKHSCSCAVCGRKRSV